MKTITSRRLARSVATRQMSRSQSFRAFSIGRNSLGEGIDPFLQLDHFFMGQPTFPPHPHAGFSAVTYLFEDSEGSFINRDTMSAEDSVLIHPGDLHWTQSGSGMVHEETPTEPGKVCHGLQMFVNLAAVNKFSEPKAFHLNSSSIPIYEDGKDGRVRVLAGDAFGLSSPLQTLTPVTILDAFLSGNEERQHTIAADCNAFILVIKGEGTVGSDNQRLAAGSAGLFDRSGEEVLVKATSEALQYVLFSGKPLGEPIYSRGPFVMNSMAQIQQVQASYATGKMGRLA